MSEHLENESDCGCGKDKEIDFLQFELSRLKLRNKKLEAALMEISKHHIDSELDGRLVWIAQAALAPQSPEKGKP